MTRYLLSLIVSLAISSNVFAQDMPLSQILIPGEDWSKPARTIGPLPALAAVLTRSADGNTDYTWTPAMGLFIGARPVGVPASQAYVPYCPIRVKPGQKETRVTALTADKDGRIYAATPLGVQVFDPTGRMCGVLTTPPGDVDAMLFEDDKLVLRIGATQYTRKLRTTGVKPRDKP